MILLLVLILQIHDSASQFTCLADQQCTRRHLVCDAEQECTFICKGTTACAWSHLTCKDGYDCVVVCTGGFDQSSPDFLTCFNTTVRWYVNFRVKK